MKLKKALKKIEKNDIVWIRWVDSASQVEFAWEPIEETLERSKDIPPIRSVGIVLYCDEKTITIIQAVSDIGITTGRFTIPKCSITKIKFLCSRPK